MSEFFSTTSLFEWNMKSFFFHLKSIKFFMSRNKQSLTKTTSTKTQICWGTVRDFNFYLIFIFLSGAVIGLLSTVRFIKFLYEKERRLLLSIFFGLVIFCIPLIWVNEVQQIWFIFVLTHVSSAQCDRNHFRTRCSDSTFSFFKIFLFTCSNHQTRLKRMRAYF